MSGASTFKRGDRVRVTAAYPLAERIGKVGTVTFGYPPTTTYQADVLLDGEPYETRYKPEELEPA